MYRIISRKWTIDLFLSAESQNGSNDHLIMISHPTITVYKNIFQDDVFMNVPVRIIVKIDYYDFAHGGKSIGNNISTSIPVLSYYLMTMWTVVLMRLPKHRKMDIISY